MGAALDERRSEAVDRGRGGVDQRHALRLAPLQQLERVAVVVLEHVAAIGLHRVRAGALVEHDVGLRRGAAAHELEELALVEVVGDVAIGEVAELVGAREVVDRDDVGCGRGR